MDEPNFAQWSVKHRPLSFDSIVGNAATKKSAKEILELGNSHALLISGESGCGKTTLAKLMAKHFSGNSKSNIAEYNVSAEGGKDDVRAMIEGARYMPMVGKDSKKVFVLEEAHGLTKQGAAALLRPIEEPPHNRLVWILVTDKPWMLDTTINNRCRKLPLTPPLETELAGYLFNIVRDEKALRHVAKEDRKKICVLVARYSGCIPREAVQLLQDVQSSKLSDPQQLKSFIVKSKAGGDAQMDKVAASILAAIFDSSSKVEERVSKLVRGYATVDPIGLINRMLYQLHALMLYALAKRPDYVIRSVLAELGNIRPQIEDMADTLLVLSRTRNNLREMVINPSTMILPILLECVFKVGDKRK